MMNSLENLKDFVHENAALSRSELELQLMGCYHLTRVQARELLEALEQELDANDPLPKDSVSLLTVLGSIETQQPPSVVTGVATMIDATVSQIEREKQP
jgi:hypothetical protein